MRHRRIYLAGAARTAGWFEPAVTDETLSLCPWIERGGREAEFALKLADDGLAAIGIEPGDFLLFATWSLTPVWNQPVLVRMEDRYIVRLAADVNPVECVFTTAGDVYPPLVLPSENIRITAVMSGVIKPHEGLRWHPPAHPFRGEREPYGWDESYG